MYDFDGLLDGLTSFIIDYDGESVEEDLLRAGIERNLRNWEKSLELPHNKAIFGESLRVPITIDREQALTISRDITVEHIFEDSMVHSYFYDVFADRYRMSRMHLFEDTSLTAKKALQESIVTGYWTFNVAVYLGSSSQPPACKFNLKGRRVMKGLNYLIGKPFVDEIYLDRLIKEVERLQTELSRINQKNMEPQIFELSIHPHDKFTASDNTNNWGSCISYAHGEYAGYSLANMVNGYMVMAQAVTGNFAPETGLDASDKSWRQFFYVAPLSDGYIIVPQTAYPYDSPLLEESAMAEIQRRLEPIVEEEFKFYEDATMYIDDETVYIDNPYSFNSYISGSGPIMAEPIWATTCDQYEEEMRINTFGEPNFYGVIHETS